MKRTKASVLLSSEAPAGSLSALIEACNFEVTLVVGLEATAAQAQAGAFDAILLVMGAEPSDSALDWIRERCDVPVVACGSSSADLERAALSAGAVYYLSWPASAAELSRALDAALARAATLDAPRCAPVSGMLGASPHIVAVKKMVQQVAASSSTVLVRGETGTGKELVARAIHEQSPRAAAPFITVHVAALPETLLESELFGYEKGAFTGATARKAGRVELAEGGTLFLDEIGELSSAMQVKLLRLIQSREYERLGSNRTLKANLRFVAATHRDIEHMVEQGTFREDLFYRLNVVTVWVPPLRARRNDVPLLVRHYFELFRSSNQKPLLKLEDSALRLLQANRWPGNVRQLVNFVERLVVLAMSDAVTVHDVKREMSEQITFLTQAATYGASAVESGVPVAGAGSSETPAAADGGNVLPPPNDSVHFSSAVRPLREEVRRAEQRALLKALHSAKGNRAQAARLLGISRRTLYTKLEEHGLD